MPSARIMSFGYDARITGTTSIARIRDNSKKLLADLLDKREDGVSGLAINRCSGLTSASRRKIGRWYSLDIALEA